VHTLQYTGSRPPPVENGDRGHDILSAIH
jgi:hypothetical protein